MSKSKRQEYDVPERLLGAAYYYVVEDEDGTMWIGNGEYESQVNYCPVTGRKAKKAVEEI